MGTTILNNISIIVAIATNRAIGKDNQLLWHLSDDLKRFKKLTTGHTLIMGRNTFLSLPNGKLPNRRHIVISDQEEERFEGCEMARSIEEAIELAGTDEECFVIGGGMVYKQFLPMAGKLYLTEVRETFEADTFFPEIDFSQWKTIFEEEVEASERNQYSHSYTEFIRV